MFFFKILLNSFEIIQFKFAICFLQGLWLIKPYSTDLPLFWSLNMILEEVGGGMQHWVRGSKMSGLA